MPVKGLSFPLRLADALMTALFRRRFSGFLEGHSYLETRDWANLEYRLENPDAVAVSRFEQAFADLVGKGECVSFAAGRMAFHSLLEYLEVGKGDEVVLTGFTCSVMANAIAKTGARALFCDIDTDTLGTSADSLESVISANTRLIVAQHSFGIPCNIKSIAAIARKHGIVLLEDCAIALGTVVDGTVIGNFGDAAIFSTDHSKPVNTFTGGMFYSSDEQLVKGVREIQLQSGELPEEKARAILQRLKFEARLCNPKGYPRFALCATLSRVTALAQGRNFVSPFLDEDQGIDGPETYPYPARFPSFLAELGMMEIQRWPETVRTRKTALRRFLDIAREEGLDKVLPGAYFRRDLDIIPLRFAWSQVEGKRLRSRIRNYVDTGQTWFMSPIISTKLPLENFGYYAGMCPVAESTGKGMVNVPVTLPENLIRRIMQEAVMAGDSDNNHGSVLQR